MRTWAPTDFCGALRGGQGPAGITLVEDPMTLFLDKMTLI